MIYAGSTKILPIVNDMMAIFYDMTVYLSLHLQGREHQAVIKKHSIDLPCRSKISTKGPGSER